MDGLQANIFKLYRFSNDFVREKIFCFGLIICLQACSTPPREVHSEDVAGPRGELTLELYGFRALKGDLLISVFRETCGFPDDTGEALLNLTIPIKTGRQQITLPPLPWGSYSYSILHDENGNGKMDRTLLGIPREGYALSNDLEGFLRQPSPEDALFQIGSVPQNHVLRIHYFKRRGRGRHSN